MLTKKLNAIAVSSTASAIRFCPQQRNDRVRQRNRAQREFLALGDVVLDEDAALGEFRRPQRKFRTEKRLSRTSASTACRRQGTPRTPMSHASSARNDRTEPGAPGVSKPAPRHRSLAPQAASDHKVPTSARTNNAIGSAEIGRFSKARKLFSSSVGATVMSRTTPRMPTQRSSTMAAQRSSTATISAVFIQAAGSRQAGNALAIGEEVALRAHVLPPRARSTSDVVLWPGRMSTSTTSPPVASTISWPTTCSRV